MKHSVQYSLVTEDCTPVPESKLFLLFLNTGATCHRIQTFGYGWVWQYLGVFGIFAYVLTSLKIYSVSQYDLQNITLVRDQSS